MEGSFCSPSTKRSIHSAGGGGGGNGSRKRSKHRPPPLTIPPGHALFRILCDASRISGFIGKSGAAIQQLQQSTAAKIRVQEATPGSDDRIIAVVASTAPSNTITFRSVDNAVADEVVEVSAAQEALVRVFERVLDVAAEADGLAAPPESVLVSCRLLAETIQAGSVIGKGGKIIENIRKDSGCKIRVLRGDKLPACAGPDDELVEIEGDVAAVKRALVAVSQRLQVCPPADKTKMIRSRSVEAIPQATLPDLRVGLTKKSSLLRPKPSQVHHLSLGEADRVSILDSETLQEEVAFKILCSNDRVGGVIGKGGSIIRSLQSETGASISIGPLVEECDERLITITALENLESQYSPAQNALCLVFARSIEAGFENGLDSSLGSSISARLVVPSNQIGCLLGKGGAIISEMRRVTGTGMRIVGSDQVPECVSENDGVIQISGEFVNVQDAICYVTSRLRDNVCSSTEQSGTGTRSRSSVITEVSPYGRARDIGSLGIRTSFAVSDRLDWHANLTRNFDNLGPPHNLNHPSSPRLLSSQMVTGGYPRGVTDIGRGFAPFKGLELGSGSKSAIVTNTTVEIVVPDNVIGSVYGENGSNLTRLRQISGAKVIIHEPHPGTNDRIVVISGTPDETQAAQSLLQAFILTGSS